MVLDRDDPVAQGQLAFLQPREPQLVPRTAVTQGVDRIVEITVLLLELSEPGRKFLIGHDVHMPPGRAVPRASALVMRGFCGRLKP